MQRSDFRLPVDIPMTWRYVKRESLAGLKAEPGHQLPAQKGEGRVIDLSYGGAAFDCREPLGRGGLAQILFSLERQPLHAMLELVSQEQAPGGRWIHRGRIRGISHEARDRVYSFLSREQLARLRTRGLLHPEPEHKSN